MTDLTTTQPARQYSRLPTTAEQTAQSTTAAPHNLTGTATTASLPSPTGGTDTAPSVQITLSQAGLDYLANATLSTTAKQTADQEALVRLDQLARSSHTAAREEAEERVNTIKAQIHQLMQIKALLSPKALAQELAQLARQLAAAVAQYTQSGGSDAADAAAGNAVLASTQAAAPSGPLAAQTASALPADSTQTTAQQPPAASLPAQVATPAGPSVTKTENDPGFAQAVQGLSAQMKALLAENRIRLKNQHITADSDSQSTQNALESIEQSIPQI